MGESRAVRRRIEALLRNATLVSTGALAQEIGITRQGVLYHLKDLLDRGDIESIGRGRATRYRWSSELTADYALAGLSEDRVWADIESVVREALGGAEAAVDIHRYALTEMTNNAVDHSEGSTLRVSVKNRPNGVEVSVVDDGIGVFRRIVEGTSAESIPDAIARLTLGKVTTDPARHKGEGIFFTSKAVENFLLEANGWGWTAVNRADASDWSMSESPVRQGTRVTWRVSGSPPRPMTAVYAGYTEEYAFSKTSTQVRLFGRDGRIISRSEARRIASGLDAFSEVTLDFAYVDQVGQGFADELFRVWASAHPRVSLKPVNTNAVVRLMIDRVEQHPARVQVSAGEGGGATTTTASTGEQATFEVEPDNAT